MLKHHEAKGKEKEQGPK